MPVIHPHLRRQQNLVAEIQAQGLEHPEFEEKVAR
jgi:hypothetical protein